MIHLTLARCLARLRAPALAGFVGLTAACETERLSPTAEPEAAQPTGALTTASPSFATSSSGRGVPFGFWRLEYTQLGSDWTGLQANASPNSIQRNLDLARSRGARVFIRFAGGSSDRYQDSQGHFSLSKFKALLDQFRRVNLDSYIADGTLAGHMLLDEPSDHRNWNGEIPFRDLEEAAKYSKSIWPNLPTFVRSVPSWLAGAPFRWTYLDGGWAQYSARKGQVDSYRDAEVRAANEEGLKIVWGLNVLDGGDGSSKRHFNSSSKYSMSATELLQYGRALLRASNSCGFLMWNYQSNYIASSGILDAVKTLSTEAKTRSASCGDAGGGVPGEQPPPPVGSNGSMAQLKSRLFSDMCVDVPASAYANGMVLITWSCHTGANQVFVWKSTGEIVPWKSQAMCIDAYSGLGRDGDPIGLWSCHGGSNQRWSATAAGEIKGINGKCIGPVSTARANGTKLSLQPCNGSTSQKWNKGGASTP